MKYLIDSGVDTGNQKGIPDSAESGSGLCPENPQPFEKGWRKLQLGVRWLIVFADAIDDTLFIRRVVGDERDEHAEQ